jgi:hypothetical protein
MSVCLSSIIYHPAMSIYLCLCISFLTSLSFCLSVSWVCPWIWPLPCMWSKLCLPWMQLGRQTQVPHLPSCCPGLLCSGFRTGESPTCSIIDVPFVPSCFVNCFSLTDLLLCVPTVSGDLGSRKIVVSNIPCTFRMSQDPFAICI